VVLMDLNMPEMNGLAATRLISAELEDVKVVVLTASEDDADRFEASRAAPRATSSRTWRQTSSFACWRELRAAIRRSPPTWQGSCSASSRDPPAPERSEPELPEPLTDRERDVLDLLVQGVTANRELAERQVVSENTVKYHVRNILAKLHVQNRAQLVAYAMRHGIAGSER